jgi:hypothetical protein
MPFQPGILFSAFLLVLCLGINLTYYPTVRGMFHEPTDKITAVSSKQPVLKSNKTDSILLPSLPQNKENSAQSSVPVPATPVKTSKVNKPIQLDPLPELPKEKEKIAQTLEKKSDIFDLPLETKPDKPKTNINVPKSEKNEIKSKQSELKQTEPKQSELKQPEPKQSESKQPEPKQSELKQPEPKQSALKQPEPKQLEPKQPDQKQLESKQSAFSAPTVLPLPPLDETYSLWDNKKSGVSSQPSSSVPDTKFQKKTEEMIQHTPNIPNNQTIKNNQNKLTANSESAFLPIIPPSLEREYWEPNNQNVNQLAMLKPSSKTPILNEPVLQSSQPMPAYANAYVEPKQSVSPPDLSLQKKDKSNPVEAGDSMEKIKPKPPTFIWETIDSALERPLMYENP